MASQVAATTELFGDDAVDETASETSAAERPEDAETAASATLESQPFPTFGLQLAFEPGTWSIDPTPALSGFVGRWTLANAESDDFTQFSIRVLPGAGADAGPEVLAAVAERYTARDYTVTEFQMNGHDALRLDKPDTNTNAAAAGPLLLTSHGGRVYEVLFLMPDLDEAAVRSVVDGWEWLPVLPVASWVELSAPVALFEGRAQLALPAAARQVIAADPIASATHPSHEPEASETSSAAEGDLPPAEPIRFVAWDYVSREAVLTLVLEPRAAPDVSLDLVATDYAHLIFQTMDPADSAPGSSATPDTTESTALLVRLPDHPNVYASDYLTREELLPDGRLAARSTRYLVWESEPGFFVSMSVTINDDVTPGSVAQANCRRLIDQVVASIRTVEPEQGAVGDILGRSH